MHNSLGRMLSLRLTSALIVVTAALVLANAPRAAATDWPQAHSDLRGDPAVLFGKLPNGMRYAIRRNATPKGAVSMWLNVQTGSMQESDAQQGLAHFLEHMTFRGSRHVADKDVWPGLQRLGIAFGADANAATSFENTQYQFDFPHSDATTIDTGLLRLRDLVSELTLAQSAMDTERGVILSEERLRDTPQLGMMKRQLALWFPNARVLSRMPIGLTDIIKHAPVSLIRDYYNAFYRPDRTTLIVVGEVDPRAIQAKIVKEFSDWQPTGPAGADPARTVPGPRKPQAALFVDPGAPSLLGISWITKSAPDSKARETQDFIKLVALKVLESRLKDAKHGNEHLFAETQIEPDREFPGSVVWSAFGTLRPQDWKLALEAAVREARRMDKFGITADELARAESEFRAELETAVAQASTTPTRSLAAHLAEQVSENEVFTSPADGLALADEIFKSVTLQDMNAAIHRFMSDHGPLVFLSSPAPIDGGEASVSTALAAAEKAPLTAPAAEARVSWPYTSFGTPGKVVAQTSVADLQTTFVRFANGVRLTVKPTAFKRGEIVVAVRIGDGRLGLPADRDTPAWAISDNGFAFGGLKALSFEDMQRALSGKVFGTSAGLADDGLMLFGRTRPTDLLTQLQVFAAYVSAPGWRSGTIERARTQEMEELLQSTASPTDMFIRQGGCLLRSGDRRWCRPDRAELAQVKANALEQMLAPTLASAPIEVTMAGDVTIDAAVTAVAATLGALPSRAAPGAMKSISLRFPSGEHGPAQLHHEGRGDQGVAALAWPTTDAFDVAHVQALRVLKSVMETRITDQLRGKESVTYSPFSLLDASKIAHGYGYLVAVSELPPGKMPLFFSAAQSIAADLRAHPISADELERARKPEVEGIIAEQQTNGYWVRSLIGAQQDPRRLDIIRNTVPDLEKVTAQDVQQAANKFLADDKSWKLEITADPKLAAKPGPKVEVKSGPAPTSAH